MLEGNENTKKLLFQLTLCSRKVLEVRGKELKALLDRGHRGGDDSKDVIVPKIQEVLCGLCG
jgi:hypothetical protein